jgi:hypothetical protein
MGTQGVTTRLIPVGLKYLARNRILRWTVALTVVGLVATAFIPREACACDGATNNWVGGAASYWHGALGRADYCNTEAIGADRQKAADCAWNATIQRFGPPPDPACGRQLMENSPQGKADLDNFVQVWTTSLGMSCTSASIDAFFPHWHGALGKAEYCNNASIGPDRQKAADCAFQALVRDKGVSPASCLKGAIANSPQGKADLDVFVQKWQVASGADCSPASVAFFAPHWHGALGKADYCNNASIGPDRQKAADCAFQALVRDKSVPQTSCLKNTIANTPQGSDDLSTFVATWTLEFSTHCSPDAVDAFFPTWRDALNGHCDKEAIGADRQKAKECAFQALVQDRDVPPNSCLKETIANSPQGVRVLDAFVRARPPMKLTRSNGTQPPPFNAPPGKKPRAFNMVVLGDSYMWQPGLLMEEKAFTLVQRRIETFLKDSRDVAVPRVFARSGAIIGTAAPFAPVPYDGCSVYPLQHAKDVAAAWPADKPFVYWDDQHPEGDKDYAAPSVWMQLIRAQDETRTDFVRPDNVDLVLIDGGGNDIGVMNIVSPLPADYWHEPARVLTRWCVGRMQQLLPAVARAFPNAGIVVTGYPQVVTSSSNSFTLLGFVGTGLLPTMLAIASAGSGAAGGGMTAVNLAQLSVVVGVATVASAPGIRDNSSVQSGAFAEVSSNVLRKAVEETPRTAFADVRTQWGDLNGYGAPNSYFWHFTAPQDPPDHTHVERGRICNTHGHIVTGGTTDILCTHGAMGHPNVEGAKAYAKTILLALDGFGLDWLGMKSMTVCADAVSVRAPNGGIANSVTLHANDPGSNASVNAIADLNGISLDPLDKPFVVPLCNAQPQLGAKRGVTCNSLISVKAPGFASVTFRVGDIFGAPSASIPIALPPAEGTSIKRCFAAKLSDM